MTIKRIKCYEANCENCEQHISLKENIFGQKMYTCFTEPKKHKGTIAKTCDEFRCNDYGMTMLCEECNLGKPLKKIKIRV